ncbi:YigZ family protein [Marinobacter salicampi]|uniref:YigZ family protein n=1 Tax=Marinobacter salicampi TaxID=435907 RepID=UPI00140E5A49|nr:YigZ family protein [Marinobacter salicampi]
MKAYPIPAGALERETEVRKSHFIARVAPVHSREDMQLQVARIRSEHPAARHLCWAYQIGKPGSAAEAGMNDDGEPSGTAGKPILGVIQHKDMGDVLVTVVRYFGGVKLGAGGLVRAYAGAAESVLSEVERTVPSALTAVTLALDFALEQALRHWAGQHDAEIKAVGYDTGVSVRLEVPDAHLEALLAFCGAQGMDYSLDS